MAKVIVTETWVEDTEVGPIRENKNVEYENCIFHTGDSGELLIQRAFEEMEGPLLAAYPQGTWLHAKLEA